MIKAIQFLFLLCWSRIHQALAAHNCNIERHMRTSWTANLFQLLRLHNHTIKRLSNNRGRSNLPQKDDMGENPQYKCLMYFYGLGNDLVHLLGTYGSLCLLAFPFLTAIAYNRQTAQTKPCHRLILTYDMDTTVEKLIFWWHGTLKEYILHIHTQYKVHIIAELIFTYTERFYNVS